MHQIGPHQFLKMETQSGIRYAQFLDQLGGGEAVVTALHDHAKDVQPRLLAEGQEGSNGGFVIHISNYMEIYDRSMTAPIVGIAGG